MKYRKCMLLSDGSLVISRTMQLYCKETGIKRASMFMLAMMSALGEHRGPDFCYFKGLNLLREYTLMSNREIHLKLRQLEEIGTITRGRRGYRGKTTYFLTMGHI